MDDARRSQSQSPSQAACCLWHDGQSVEAVHCQQQVSQTVSTPNRQSSAVCFLERAAGRIKPLENSPLSYVNRPRGCPKIRTSCGISTWNVPSLSPSVPPQFL